MGLLVSEKEAEFAVINFYLHYDLRLKIDKKQ